MNDILDISKIEAGKLELETRVFNLHDVLHAAVEIVKVWNGAVTNPRVNLA